MNLKYKKRMFEFGDQRPTKKKEDFVLKDVEVDFVPKKEDMKNIDFGGLQKSLFKSHNRLIEVERRDIRFLSYKLLGLEGYKMETNFQTDPIQRNGI